MTEKEKERQQVEWVFGLTGGELDDKPLAFIGEDGEPRSWAYHYEGLPEYASTDYADRFDSGVTYFTLVEVGNEYGSSAPDVMRFADGSFAVKIGEYANSGETECPDRNGNDEDKIVGEGNTEGLDECPLCEASAGEEHGFIYIGSGSEIVYKQLDISCEGCGVYASEIRASGVNSVCDCDEETSADA